MLARSNRISKKLFPLLKRNKLYMGEFFCVRATFLEKNPSGAVCIISKKTEKGAVKRNLMKRRVYEIIKTNLETTKKSTALQIFPQKNAFTTSFENIRNDLHTIITINNLL